MCIHIKGARIINSSVFFKFAYNNFVNAYTKVSPFYLMYNAHSIILSSLMKFLKGDEFSTKIVAVNRFVEHLHQGLHQQQRRNC